MSAHPRRLLSLRTRSCRTPLSGCSSLTASLARPTSGTDALDRLSGSHRLASRSSGSARGLRREGAGTCTLVPVSVHVTSLRCLLSEASQGEGLGIPSLLLGCLAVLFGVYELPETHFPFCALCLARQRIQFMCQSSAAFGCYFTQFRVKVDVGS